MRKFDQCPICFHTLKFIDGVAYCVTCDDIVVENEDETENDITLPF